MRHAIASSLLALLPVAAVAQEIPVRTGEHADFTRIAIDFPDAPGWDLSATGRTWRLTMEDESRFDLSGIHARIGRDRIRDITQPAPGRIDIEIACDCAPRSFEFDGVLVIDVRDGGAPEPDGGTPPARLIRDLARDLSLPDPAAPRQARAATPRPAPEDAAPADRARSLREDVLAEMARSVESGIVTLRNRLPDPPAAPPPAPASPPPEPRLEPGSNLRIETRAERDRRGSRRLPAGAACPPALEGTRAAWAAAGRRIDLDAPDAALAQAEAMGLIVRGLGTEAATLLRPHLEAGADAALLHQVAGIVDTPGPAPALAALAECSDLFALFAVLADPPSAPARVDPLLGALEQFDGALRMQFGRRVMAALADLNRAEEARIVENALLRLDPALEGDDLADRRFGAGTREASPEEAMAEMADRTPEAAAALRSLMDGMRRRGEDVPADVIDHAAALAPELAAEERALLLASMIRAGIAQLNLEAAARRIAALRPLDAESAAGLEAGLYAALAAIPDDAVFLQQAGRFADRPAPESERRLEIARRIAALHVPDLALDHLDATAAGAGEAERLLAAELTLATGAAEAARDLLDGLSGARADRIRAEALARLAPAPVPVAAPAGTGPLAVIERSAALRAKYRDLLGGE